MAHLHFKDLPPALSIWNAMLAQRMGPDLAAMVALLRYHIQHGKRVSPIWRRIRRRWLTPKAVLELDALDHGYARDAFRIMLGELKARGNSQMWHQVYNTALSRGFSMLNILVTPSDTSHHFDELKAEDDIATKLRLGRKILERRFDILTTDFRMFKTHMMAAQIILAGLPAEQVYALFESHAKPDTYHSWKQERPWLKAEYGRQVGSEVAKEDDVEIRRLEQPEDDLDEDDFDEDDLDEDADADDGVVPTRPMLIKRLMGKQDKASVHRGWQEYRRAKAAALKASNKESPERQISRDGGVALVEAARPVIKTNSRKPWSRDETTALMEAVRPVNGKKSQQPRSQDGTKTTTAAASSVSAQKPFRPWSRDEAAALVAAARPVEGKPASTIGKGFTPSRRLKRRAEIRAEAKAQAAQAAGRSEFVLRTVYE